jgi:endonuclease III
VKATCRILTERYHGRVPTTMEELLTLRGSDARQPTWF